ncbi:hypothetical protein M378DRAFT_13050 [Amanita muscaria Koide BX008]|uniref:Hydrophobin n=1 Tax=Amanita muscaria (strain Koide BX008) TaxID=946122 RepID=A0A0C2WZ13_AMAMK|nr:hypothetical protein M378DRAFT_13050 [Amanita muscaria Koide BX008]
MFISRIVLFALPVFAAATAVPRANGNNGKNGNNGNNGKNGNNGNNGGTTNTGGNNSCTQGTAQFCCNNVQSANALSSDNKWLLGILGINTNALIGQVGLSCNPSAGSSASCNAQSVCCQNSQGSGIIVNNCSPVIINV